MLPLASEFFHCLPEAIAAQHQISGQIFTLTLIILTLILEPNYSKLVETLSLASAVEMCKLQARLAVIRINKRHQAPAF